MTVRVGIIMDPIAQIAFRRTARLPCCWPPRREAGHSSIWSSETFISSATRPAHACARCRSSTTRSTGSTGEEVDMALADLDVILMRKDPPFNSEYVYATYLLELAEKAGTLVVNRPQSLRDCNEVLRHSVPAVHTADLGQPTLRHSPRVCQRAP